MIKKPTPAQILNLGGTFTTLPNKSLELISDAITLGVWAFLISKPHDWTVNRKNVCKRLNLSVRRYYSAMRQLKEANLCREYVIRGEKGIIGNTTVLVSMPSDWNDAESKLKAAYADFGEVKFTLLRSSHKCKDQDLKTEKLNKTKISSGVDSFVETTKLWNSQNVVNQVCDKPQNETHTNNRYIQKTEEQKKQQQESSIQEQKVKSPRNASTAAALSDANAKDAVSPNLIEKRISDLIASDYLPYGSEAQSFEAIVKLLKNPKSYSASHDQPLKKFNVICKAIRNGGLDLNLEASAVHQVIEAPEIRAIRDQIGDLERRKQGNIQAIKKNEELQNTLLTERFEQEIQEFNQGIETLKAKLGSLLADSLTSLAPMPAEHG